MSRVRGGGFRDPVGTSVERVAAAEALARAIKALSPREAQILMQRFGLIDGEPKTLDELGLINGVTRERIRQIEEKALKKLSHPDVAAALDGFQDTPRAAPLGGRASSGAFFQQVEALRARAADVQRCPTCDSRVYDFGLGRPPTYCSNACRQAAYRARRKSNTFGVESDGDRRGE